MKTREFCTAKLRLFLVLILLGWMCDLAFVNEFLRFLLLTVSVSKICVETEILPIA